MCILTLPRDVGSVTTAGSPTSKVWPQGAVSTVDQVPVEMEVSVILDMWILKDRLKNLKM